MIQIPDPWSIAGVLAFANHWPPAVIDELTVDEALQWIDEVRRIHKNMNRQR